MTINNATISNNTLAREMARLLEASVFTLGEYNRLIEEGQDVSTIQSQRRLELALKYLERTKISKEEFLNWAESSRSWWNHDWSALY